MDSGRRRHPDAAKPLTTSPLTTKVPTAEPARADRQGSRRIPALDGIRGIAVLAVLAYHGGFRWARGGYLGVSSFFTLSGFLIAGLLVGERRRTGTVRLRNFWARRARRLLPPALATLLAIAVVELITHHWASTRLRGDLWSSLFYVANWRFASGHSGYGSLFTAPSPVLHFWSLGVEEQFYVVFPLLVLGVTALAGLHFRRRSQPSTPIVAVALTGSGRSTRRQRRLEARQRVVLAVVLTGLTVASFWAAWASAAHGSNDGWGYYASTHRAGELLVGAVLAIAWSRRPQPRRRAERVLALAGCAGLAWLVYAWSTIGLSDRFLFRGGVEANAIATGAVIVGCLVPGPLERVMAWSPLSGLGRISYGVYLYHWPLYAFITERALGFGGFALFVVRLAAVVAVSTASFFVLEEPIRVGRSPARRLAPGRVVPSRMLAGAATAVVIVASMVMLIHPRQATEASDFTRHRVESRPVVQRSVGPVRADWRASQAGRPPLRLLVAGDSFAYTMSPGTEKWTKETDGPPLSRSYRFSLGCPLSGGGMLRFGPQVLHTYSDCATFVDDVATKIRTEHPDVVLIVGGLADLGDRRFDRGPMADGQWHHLGEPDFDRWDLGQLMHDADEWQAVGGHVIWATMPAVRVTVPASDVSTPEDDPGRLARFNDMVRQTVAGHPGFILTDLHGWMDALPGGALSAEWRRDGVHLTVADADRVARHLIPLAYRAAGRPL